MKIIILLIFALWIPVIASAEELVFDQNWQLKYRIEDGRIYDQNGQPKGYLQDGKIYDNSWQLKGRIEKGDFMTKSMTPPTSWKVTKKGIDFPVRSGRQKVILKELLQEAEGNDNESFRSWYSFLFNIDAPPALGRRLDMIISLRN